MDCPLRSGHDLAEAYVTGTLPEAELDAYEQHFYDCPACLAQVKSLQALADRLRQLPAGPAPYPTTSPGRSAAPWLALACAAGLIAGFGWWWQGGATRAMNSRRRSWLTRSINIRSEQPSLPSASNPSPVPVC